MPELRIVEAGKDRASWDRFVAADVHSTFAHQHAWRDIMAEVLGHESFFFAAVGDDGGWRGVLPLVRVRTILGHYLISLPFLSDGGPLGDAAAQAGLVRHAVAEAKGSGASLLELRARHDVPGPVSASNRRISVHLDLPPSSEELWKSILRGKLRAQVRRPGKEGMTFLAGANQLPAFYEVFSRNMRDLGTPVLPREFFVRIAAEFGPRVVFASVRTRSGAPAAVACCFIWRDELEVMWAASIRKLNPLSPNMMLYASLMEEAIARRVRVFNFGRCPVGSATHRFKQQWGGRDVPLPWPSWSRAEHAGVPARDRRGYRLAVAIWRHLPLAVANRVGPVLSRMLP